MYINRKVLKNVRLFVYLSMIVLVFLLLFRYFNLDLIYICCFFQFSLGFVSFHFTIVSSSFIICQVKLNMPSKTVFFFIFFLWTIFFIVSVFFFI